MEAIILSRIDEMEMRITAWAYNSHARFTWSRITYIVRNKAPISIPNLPKNVEEFDKAPLIQAIAEYYGLNGADEQELRKAICYHLCLFPMQAKYNLTDEHELRTEDCDHFGFCYY